MLDFEYRAQFFIILYRGRSPAEELYHAETSQTCLPAFPWGTLRSWTPEETEHVHPLTLNGRNVAAARTESQNKRRHSQTRLKRMTPASTGLPSKEGIQGEVFKRHTHVNINVVFFFLDQ